MGLPSMKELEKLAEQQNFKQLVVIAYLNRLAVITGVDGGFLPLSAVTPDDDLDSICEEYIVYDDREEMKVVAENGTALCPIVTEIMYDEEHGLNATEDADTRYGSKNIAFRAVLPADKEEDPYAICECKGLDMHIVIEGGRWYSGTR